MNEKKINKTTTRHSYIFNLYSMRFFGWFLFIFLICPQHVPSFYSEQQLLTKLISLFETLIKTIGSWHSKLSFKLFEIRRNAII